ncbi:hypothetical protein MHBO_004178 [Bonamia ostreae]|uniref:Peptidase S26 domain-containing protein n=1 Tax=Bonamia ostreae TaxID=126728 RepID=A0ABV2ASL1_9EUKA
MRPLFREKKYGIDFAIYRSIDQEVASNLKRGENGLCDTKNNNVVERGNVIVARSRGKNVAKRLAGIEDEIVEIKPKIDKPTNEKLFVLVPKKHIWILGDNTNKSVDSRYYGSIGIENLKGVIVWKLWPYDRFFGRIKKLEEKEGVLCSLKNKDELIDKGKTNIFFYKNKTNSKFLLVDNENNSEILYFGDVLRKINET